MREIVALFAALLMLGAAARYCWKIIRRKADPPITTWIIFEMGVIMSVITHYFSFSKQHGIVSNVVNWVDCAGVSAILAVLVQRHRHERPKFLPHERWCFKIAGTSIIVWAVMSVWTVSVGALVAHAGFQMVMIVAYWPTIKKLLRPGLEKSPEPFETWLFVGVASACGCYVAYVSRDWPSLAYSARAALLTTTVLLLIKRVEKLAGRGQEIVADN